MNAITRVAVVLLATAATFAQGPTQKETPSASIVGYVRDSGCVHRFHEVIKPLPNGCVEACVRGGSPLVVLKLLPFVGKLVKITGHIYSRGGSNAIALERIEEIKQ
jgi:hypothetical protein